jgi:hypothetical protein
MFLMRSPRLGAPGLMASLIRLSLAALLLCGATAGAAQARIWVGVGIPLFVPPVVVGPPAYYPPPYSYGPPVGYPPSGNTFSYTPGSQPQSLAPPGGYGPQGGYAPPGYTPPQGYPAQGGYPPPPGYPAQGGYTPSSGYTPSMGGGAMEGAQSCQAGAYVCPLVQDTPPGGACSCPGHGGQPVRGQAD